MTLLTGAPNTRDLGEHVTARGERLATGRAYRADSLARLTDADVEVLGGWGLAHVLDLRGGPEVATLGADRLPAGPVLRALPVYDDDLDIYALMTTAIGSGDPDRQAELLGAGRGERLMTEMYRWFVTHPGARAQFGAALATMADPAGVPVLFHCTAGKDRTGWLAAVALTAVGVDRAAVFADYLRTNESAGQARGLLEALRERGLVRDVALFAPLLEAREEYLAAAFAEVERGYPDFATFVTAGLGVDVAALRDNLLA
ncbi:phosphotyrosine protein phosphatase [Longispora fulva]|uniref:Protein-tyrosine phosphatase n=1 Tax=Longispora fulva TaxID=619741 RepID=A0A8J7KPF9_9ACTN|nr:tyrosine-protein phosphatase [Longispora fulva]MBG6141276.1 protein-tyrosine phosphatase [Longispora fulva]GIG62727.1 phosphotyrosine protein phosphatase [Longispora fulva]